MKSSRSSFMRPCLRKKEKGEERRGGEKREGREKRGRRKACKKNQYSQAQTCPPLTQPVCKVGQRLRICALEELSSSDKNDCG